MFIAASLFIECLDIAFCFGFFFFKEELVAMNSFTYSLILYSSMHVVTNGHYNL